MMATFPKPIVAAVQGAAVGLGTTLLPLCDLVLASEQATFHTPYARLGQVPEGAATLTLPSLLGYAAVSTKYASSFVISYTRLGHVSEAAATLMLPSLFGYAVENRFIITLLKG